MNVVIYIEAIQALQEDPTQCRKAVPLLAGKRTLVRVYLQSDSSDSAVTKMQANLKVVAGVGDADQTNEINSGVQFVMLGSDTTEVRDLRLDLAHSLNFEICLVDLFGGEQWASNSEIEVSLGLRDLFIDGTEVGITDSPTRYSFEYGESLKLHMLGLRYQDQDEIVYLPDNQHFDNIRASLENLYPINRCIASQIVVDADPEFTLPFTDIDRAEPDWEWYYKVSLAHAQLLAHRTLDLDANLICSAPVGVVGETDVCNNNSRLDETWYYGVVDYPDDDFFRGAASGIQNAGAIGKCKSEDGRAAANFDYVACGPVEDAGGLYAAHEIGHCLDLHHPGIGDQYQIEEEYPFVEGFVSVDRYPDETRFEMHELFLDPNKITADNVDAFVRSADNHGTLINNRTLRRIIERYQLNKHQDKGEVEQTLASLRKDLDDWRKARENYGVEHLGLSWHNWRFDREIVPYTDHYDFMGYLDPKWISPFSYLKLRDNIKKFKEDKKFDGSIGEPPNVCIIGLYNEFLGTGVIKYLFKTHQSPTCNPNVNQGSVQLRFDNHIVDSEYILHKDRLKNKLGDPLFLRAGIFKCVIGDEGFLGDKKTKASDARRLSLDVAQVVTDANGDGAADSKGKQPQFYKNVDQVILRGEIDDNGNYEPEAKIRCSCDRQPFQIYRSSHESEDSDFFLKFTGADSADCTYIAQARFFDRDLFEQRQEIGLTGWMTLGANFRSAEYLYLDKNHCLVPGSAVENVFKFLFEADENSWEDTLENLKQPFKRIYQVYRGLKTRENRAPDLFALAVELVCMSALNRTQVFKGLIIEKLKFPGEFYFINAEDPTYAKIKQRFDDLSAINNIDSD